MKSRTAWMALGALALALVAPGCDKTEPTADPDWVIEVTASPQTIRLGSADEGKSIITAVVYDTAGQPKGGIGVRFSTTAGRLDSGGKVVKTNDRGEAQDTLWTDEDCTVKVKSGSAEGETEVTVGGENEDPTASIVITPSGSQRVGRTVTFSGASSEDLDGEIVEYQWTIISDHPDPDKDNPDRETTQNQAITRTYSGPQHLEVTLKVVDNDGGSDTDSDVYDIVANLPPVAEAGPSQTVPKAPTADLWPVTLSGCESKDPDGRILTYQWSWGDGKTDIVQNRCVASHTYLAPGDYLVTLTVYDDGDGTCGPVLPNQSDTCPDRGTDDDTTSVTCEPGTGN